MLKLENINFPITLRIHANGEITFNGKNNGVWGNGEVSAIDLAHFIEQHNIKNPENSREKDYYYYSMGSEQNTHNASNDCRSVLESLHSSKTEINPMIKYAQIENMPICATLKGVQLDFESWLEITIEPKSIEVFDDVVTLTLHHGSIGNKTENRGIRIKRGTLVRYEVK